MYPKMLQFTPVVQETYSMTLTRNAFLPLVRQLFVYGLSPKNELFIFFLQKKVITRGSDQVAISSRFEVRNDPAVVRNFGQILIEYSKIVPDGVVAFFPSYLYMESIVAAWNDMVSGSLFPVIVFVSVRFSCRFLSCYTPGYPKRGLEEQVDFRRNTRRQRDQYCIGELPKGEL